MSQENENLTAKESLDIITNMIQQAKVNVTANSFYFLLWGWTIAFANLGTFIMIRFTTIEDPQIIFLVTIPAGIASMIHGYYQDRRATSTTLLDSINMWLWIGFGITCFILAFFGARTNWQVNPIIMTMCAAPTLVTGVLLRFKPLVYGGVAFWFFGIACFLVPSDVQFLLAAIAVMVGYLVPGYWLRNSKS